MSVCFLFFPSRIKTGLEVGDWILSLEIWNVRNQCGTLSPRLLCLLDDMPGVLIHYKTNFIFGGGGFLKMWRSLIEKSSDFWLLWIPFKNGIYSKSRFFGFQAAVMSPWPSRSRRWLGCHHQSGRIWLPTVSQSLGVGGNARPPPEQHVNTAGDQPAPAASCVNRPQDRWKCRLMSSAQRFQQNQPPFVGSPDWQGSQWKID